MKTKKKEKKLTPGFMCLDWLRIDTSWWFNNGWWLVVNRRRLELGRRHIPPLL